MEKGQKYIVAEVRGMWIDDKTPIEAKAIIGRPEFDIGSDDEIFYYFGEEEKVIGTHGDMKIHFVDKKEYDPLGEVIMEELGAANKTVHLLESGLVYYNYQGIHFRIFISEADYKAWREGGDEYLVAVGVDDDEEFLDTCLKAFGEIDVSERSRVKVHEVYTKLLEKGRKNGS